VSKGEGSERHIEVFKTNCELNDTSQKTESVTDNSISSQVDVTEVISFRNLTDDAVVPSHIENHILDVEDTQTLRLGGHINGSQQLREAVVRTADMFIGSNHAMKTADCVGDIDTTALTCCSHCGRQVPQTNYELHSLHCQPAPTKSVSKKSKDKNSNKVSSVMGRDVSWPTTVPTGDLFP